MNKIYGYARISRPTQSIDRQIRNIISAYPSAKIYQEAYTGRRLNRPEWQKLYVRLKEGDTIVFDSVSRMSRDAAEGLALYEELYHKNIELVFLKEPHINTCTYRRALKQNISLTGDKVDYILQGINQYLMELAREQIRLAFAQAQKEVDDLRQRTIEGIETARLSGKQIGQQKGRKLCVKKALSAKKVILKHSKTFGGSLSDTECMKLAGVSRNTYYKYKAQLCTSTRQ